MPWKRGFSWENVSLCCRLNYAFVRRSGFFYVILTCTKKNRWDFRRKRIIGDAIKLAGKVSRNGNGYFRGILFQGQSRFPLFIATGLNSFFVFTDEKKQKRFDSSQYERRVMVGMEIMTMPRPEKCQALNNSRRLSGESTLITWLRFDFTPFLVHLILNNFIHFICHSQPDTSIDVIRCRSSRAGTKN